MSRTGVFLLLILGAAVVLETAYQLATAGFMGSDAGRYPTPQAFAQEAGLAPKTAPRAPVAKPPAAPATPALAPSSAPAASTTTPGSAAPAPAAQPIKAPIKPAAAKVRPHRSPPPAHNDLAPVSEAPAAPPAAPPPPPAPQDATTAPY